MTLFAASLCLVVFSYFLFAFGVHTYCEDRPGMLGIAVAAAVTVYYLASRWPTVSWRRAVAVVGILLCLIVVGFNGWYFVWATTTCNQQSRLR
jgi:hypothetical protein